MPKLPDKKYKVLYVDPPWKFKSWSLKGTARSAMRHYKVMKTKDICKLPIGNLAAKDSILLIWAVGPQLPDALEVIDAWGFTYKTLGFTWMKQNSNAPRLFYDSKDIFSGMGYWTRSNCELCLLATRGKPKRLHKDVMQAVFSPLREHSRKPSEIYERIERLAPGPYMECFARKKHPGWDSWGRETGKF